MNNKILKWVLIVLNGMMLLLAIKWYFKNYEDEPLICIIGQLIILLSVFMEKKFPNVRNINNENSEIDTDMSSDNDAEVLNKGNKGSKITTKIRLR